MTPDFQKICNLGQQVGKVVSDELYVTATQ